MPAVAAAPARAAPPPSGEPARHRGSRGADRRGRGSQAGRPPAESTAGNGSGNDARFDGPGSAARDRCSPRRHARAYSLTFAPLPRSRPDSTLLAESLEKGEGPASLAVDAEDAIAALAARSTSRSSQLPAGSSPSPCRCRFPRAVKGRPRRLWRAPRPSSPLPMLPPRSRPKIGTARLTPPMRSPPVPVRVPAPRPLALAFAEAGLRSADAPRAAAPGKAAARQPVVKSAIAAGRRSRC
jgi:hypothetical protein